MIAKIIVIVIARIIARMIATIEDAATMMTTIEIGAPINDENTKKTTPNNPKETQEVM